MKYSALKELLVSENVYDCIKKEEDALFGWIPELKLCKGFDQKNSWHIYDVYEHILHVVAGVEPELIVRLAALFHDIGKPAAFTEDENGVGHFWGHWEHSRDIFNLYAGDLGLTDEDTALIESLIFYHDINVGKMTDSQLSEMTEKIGHKHIGKLFAIKRADLLAQSEQYHDMMSDIQVQEKAILERFGNKPD